MIEYLDNLCNRLYQSAANVKKYGFYLAAIPILVYTMSASGCGRPPPKEEEPKKSWVHDAEKQLRDSVREGTKDPCKK